MSLITPIATYLLYLTLSLPDSHFCTFEDRKASTTTQLQSVCALYTGNCASGFCQKTFASAQSACQDENIIAYTTGECNHVSVQTCSADTQVSSEEIVCSFSVQRRLGGVSQDFIKSSVTATEACKSDSTAFFVKSDCSTIGNAGNICTKDMRTEATKCTPATETINCVYYAGGDCQGQLCRKTQKTDCSLCQDSSVLFFIEGACEKSVVKVDERLLHVQQPIDDPNGLDLSNDDANVETEVENNEDQNNGWDLSNDVPEVEAKTLEDGTIELTPVSSKIAPEDDPNGLDLSNDVPEVEAETLADGTVMLTPVAPEDDPNGLDLSNDDATVEPEVENDEDQNNGWDLSNDVPEVEAKTLEDGTIELTPVSSKVALEDDPNGWDLSNDVPEVEAETLEDGTIMLTPVAPQDDPNGWDLSNDDAGVAPEFAPEDDPNGLDLSNDVPEVEAETLADGTVMLTPVAPEDDPNGLDLSNDDANVEPEVNDEDQDNSWYLNHDDSGVEETETDQPAIDDSNTGKDSKPSNPYNTHNFKFPVLGNNNEPIKAEFTNGAGETVTIASFQEPSEEN